VVEYAVNLVKDGKKNDFKGAYNRQIKENDERVKRE
jgi:hypothetical protein